VSKVAILDEKQKNK